MLTIIPIQSSLQKQEILKDFIDKEKDEAEATTWVVSDLRSKFDIQSEFLKKRSYFEDFSVLRASELWRQLFRRSFPEYQVVSQDWIRTLVKENLDNLPAGQKLGAHADQLVCDLLDHLCAIYFHPEGPKVLKQFFTENPSAQQRWGLWSDLSFQFAKKFHDEKTVTLKWIPAMLAHGNLSEKTWNRNLIVDLSGQLSQSEAELLKAIAKFVNVTVMMPDPSWKEDFKFLLTPYEQLLGAGKVQKPAAVEQSKVTQNKYRFSGPLAEVKHVTAQIRTWLEAGVPANKVLVTAPDIEAYWPLLKSYLEVEGIPVEKETSSRLQAFPVISRWLSQLRIRCGKVQTPDLENAYYGLNVNDLLSYSDFESLFSIVFGEEDLQRHLKMKEAFSQKINLKDKFTVEEFVAQTLVFWTGESFDVLEVILKDLFTQAPHRQKMGVSSWLYFLENVISKKEVRIENKDASGVLIANLMSADNMTRTHRIFIGLQESALKPQNRKYVLESQEIFLLSQKFGFFVENPEFRSDVFELNWAADNGKIEDQFTFPLTNFSGSAEAPSSFWILQNSERTLPKESHKSDSVETCRWDELQEVSEITEEEYQGTAFKELPSLSATSLGKIGKCGFIFLAEKGFFLNDPEIMDLDVSRMKGGSFIHALLEKLGPHIGESTLPDAELLDLIEAQKIESVITVVEPLIWDSRKKAYLDLAKRFLEFEKQWQVAHPDRKVLATEQMIGFDYEGIKFSGKIDRLDIDPNGNVTILDYKSGGGSAQNWGSWIKDNNFQLPFYLWALEKKFVPEVQIKEVVGAFFYVLKNMDRTKGLAVAEKSRGAGISAADKDQLIKDFESLIMQLLQKVKDGDLAPRPLQEKDCDKCRWRKLCRAPHLI